MNGVVLEDKTHSLSIHFREFEEDVPQLARAVSHIVQSFIDDGYVRINTGKKVFDITPGSWNKGMRAMAPPPPLGIHSVTKCRSYLHRRRHDG